MSCLGNLIWFIFGGFIGGLEWLVIGVLWCITIVGIPIGLQCFKLSKLQFFPFGKDVVTRNDNGTSFLLNIIWIILCGIPLAITNLISAFFLCLTIVGIPFAAQSIKMAKLSLAPFGKEVV